MFEIPKPIIERMDELSALVEANPIDVSISDVAAFLRMDAESLRACIETGHCPFAMGWKRGPRANRVFKIPVAPLYFWFTVNCGMVEARP